MADTLTTILGPIYLRDPETKKQKTSAQVLSTPNFDSRLPYRRQISKLTYCKIREVRQDPTIQLARMAVVAPMVHTPWIYHEKKGAPKGAVDRIKEYLEPQRDWLIQNAIYGALDFGWQPFEILYTYNGDHLSVGCFKPLLQDFTTILVYTNTGMFAGFVNEPATLGGFVKNTIIPLRYAFNAYLSIEGTDWYGQSVYNSLYYIDQSWREVESTSARFDRKIAGATWILHYPVGTTLYKGVETSNDEIADDLLSRVEASGSIAVPDEVQDYMDDSLNKTTRGKWFFELVSASNSTQGAFIDRQKYLDNLKMRAFGLPERAILEGSHGTKAEASEHADIALGTIDTKHRLFTDLINEQVINKDLRLNYGKEYEGYVWITPAPMIDMQYGTVKEIYRLILQNKDTLLQEIGSIDTAALRTELGVPSNVVKKEIELLSENKGTE